MWTLVHLLRRFPSHDVVQTFLLVPGLECDQQRSGPHTLDQLFLREQDCYNAAIDWCLHEVFVPWKVIQHSDNVHDVVVETTSLRLLIRHLCLLCALRFLARSQEHRGQESAVRQRRAHHGKVLGILVADIIKEHRLRVLQVQALPGQLLGEGLRNRARAGNEYRHGPRGLGRARELGEL